jgi:hypothetical protein
MFAARTLIRPMGQGTFGALIVEESIVQLMRALAPEDIDLDLPESALPGGGTAWTLRDLQGAGLVTGTPAAGLEVPGGLRAAVAHGLLLLVTLLARTDDE